ncbi:MULTISPECIES: DUF2061 domain-containing protein [Flavobacteriaceae]|uniref:DUF2061 domain-containing protein n=1 Tax=Croceivirga radicis TaxID=1929488 RepID=A0A1V6LUK0_9FLAO|nr:MULTISPECIES: DUF2061 domain-containing protein [Flavobacteriaceae]NJB36132.1 DUF2061 domain-containing protein [Croceivirga sp. JEA036]OQD43840.1 hypothetical protein BUL40_04340 [Croceivirga radicis]TKD66727.1 DUF2061 domain-containing protein [Flavobacterium sp. ASW18X]
MIADQLVVDSKKEKSTYAKDKNAESPKRSIAKSISWRIVGTIDTVIISWIVTGTLTLAFSIGLIELVTKMVLYFFHERIWNSISWGKK